MKDKWRSLKVFCFPTVYIEHARYRLLSLQISVTTVGCFNQQLFNAIYICILKHQIEIETNQQFGSGKRSNLRRVKYPGGLARRSRKRSHGAENEMPCMRPRLELTPEVATPRSNHVSVDHLQPRDLEKCVCSHSLLMQTKLPCPLQFVETITM